MKEVLDVIMLTGMVLFMLFIITGYYKQKYGDSDD